MKHQVLLEKLREKAKNEQRLTLEVIELIRQVERSKIYLKIGYGSLFDFVTKDLGYEPSSAMRRIHAARLMQEIPQLTQKISKKELSLTVVAQAQTFFRKESKVAGKRVSLERKKEVLKKLENKSTREAEKVLVSINPIAVKHTEKRRELSESLTEFKIVLDKESCQKLEDLKKKLSHQNPDMTDRGLIELLIKKAHKEVAQPQASRPQKHDSSSLKLKAKGIPVVMPIEPQLKNGDGLSKTKTHEDSLIPGTSSHLKDHGKSFSVQAHKTPANSTKTSSLGKTSAASVAFPTKTASSVKTSAPEKVAAPVLKEPIHEAANRAKGKTSRKALSKKTRAFIWERDRGCCQYRDPQSGRQCRSKAFLEIDHIKRVRDGGENDPENLRLLCRNHNQWRG